MEKINELTANKFEFLRLNEIVVDKEKNLVSITFLVPSEILTKKLTDIDFQEIENACCEILPKQFKKEIKYIKSMLDEDIVRRHVRKFFKEQYVALIGQIDMDEIKVNITGKKVEIDISAYDYICVFCKGSGLDKKIEEYLDSCYCGDNKINFVEMGNIKTTSIVDIKDEIIYADTNIINVSNKHALIGKGIGDSPKYISKCTKPADSVCVCGIVQNFERHISKSKGRIFYTFQLTDTTGVMSCAKFTVGKNHACLDGFENEKTVIVTGKLEEDSYSAKGNKLFVDKMDYCEIDFLELKERQEKLKSLQKVKVKSYPQKYVDTRQKNLLEFAQQPCKFLRDNTFVVFDLETTGLSKATDRIIEIGAVKIENGEIVSFYGTYVDPEKEISDDATRINHITNDMVKDAPYIEDVIDDFYNYTKGCYLVAHNADFDTGFIRKVYQKVGLVLENRVIDTMELAREVEPGVGKVNLGYLCKHYDIELLNAHRAYYDAEATAQLLIKLLNKKYENEND
ncbi:MAG: exonuclease domain-containing protein [Clostridia bacterium]